MLKSLKVKNLALIFSVMFILNSCASKSEQEYNKPALYWYNKMMTQIGMNDLDSADDTFTSLESEHRNSPYIPTAMLILVNAHMSDEQYVLANFYLDEYQKRFSLSKDIDYVRYMKIKSNFMGFKQQFRDQQLIDDTLSQIADFKNKYKNSPYMPLVDTMNSRLLMAKASMDKEIAALYERRDKPKAAEYYMQRAGTAWIAPEEIEEVKVPFYRAIFE